LKITVRLKVEKAKVDRVAEKQKAEATDVLKPTAEANKVAQKTRLIPKAEVMEMPKRSLGLKLWSEAEVADRVEARA